MREVQMDVKGKLGASINNLSDCSIEHQELTIEQTQSLMKPLILNGNKVSVILR